jgi:hypothetical protein
MIAFLDNLKHHTFALLAFGLMWAISITMDRK